ncbi:peptidoglycan DD-metalloendopeptidase family protein [Shewanella sp. OMA3-2]|uniref:peptidoglycan DD-metalloendopeptidase family protein n=1 Tax=Shewanella sp. OMA3-2 TaxID=2908650 RepID=UPI001F2BE324|nr:peptidoglycan DD-metalloendopeptidase family protein [Shewanella sp. OMA3-2]UJF21408.1 peptidoglycan DD-metalloendopeptidase family protein [Shewanella sp. OMA3-2]
MCSFLLRLSILSIFLSGCSFQANQPAPVENISSSTYSPKYNRGSLTDSAYIVKKGDTLYSISWGAGRNFTEVARLNNLKMPYTIYPGQKIELADRSANSAAQNSHYNTSVVTSQAATLPYPRVNSSKNSKINQPQTRLEPNQTVNATTVKKVLDHQAKPAYSVTTTQHKINQTESPLIADLPSKVQKWYWPVKGKIVGYFSSSEQGNQGIKIAGNRGDIIQAAADGRVVYAGDALRGYGNLVIIKHNDEYLSAYAHTDKILVKEKQYVSAGQTVAKMGSTRANQVMLHFEIRHHGKSVNPLRYLPKQ